MYVAVRVSEEMENSYLPSGVLGPLCWNAIF